MATDSKVTSIDSLSKEDRSVVVYALELMMTSQLRAAKAAKGPAVSDAYKAEAVKTESLLARFR